MSESIVRKTLITTGALVGALVAFVGTLTAISLLVASHAVGPSADAGAGATPGGVRPLPQGIGSRTGGSFDGIAPARTRCYWGSRRRWGSRHPSRRDAALGGLKRWVSR